MDHWGFWIGSGRCDFLRIGWLPRWMVRLSEPRVSQLQGFRLPELAESGGKRGQAGDFPEVWEGRMH